MFPVTIGTIALQPLTVLALSGVGAASGLLITDVRCCARAVGGWPRASGRPARSSRYRADRLFEARPRLEQVLDVGHGNAAPDRDERHHRARGEGTDVQRQPAVQRAGDCVPEAVRRVRLGSA
jgi:hypothetical protein